MSGTLRGPRAKIERAKKHVHELGEAVGGDFVTVSHETHPDLILREKDFEAKKTVYKVGKIPEVPDPVAAIAGDAIHNLRSALDLLIAQLIRAAGNTPCEEYFPIAGSRKKFESRCKSEIEGRVGQDALDLIKATEAYRGGKGDPLWRVHRLDIEDKHRLLYLLGVVPKSQTLTLPTEAVEGFSDSVKAAMAGLMGQVYYRPADRPVLNEGDVLYVGLLEQENEPQFRLEIAFAESEIVEAKPVLPTLVEFGQTVEGTVEAFASLL